MVDPCLRRVNEVILAKLGAKLRSVRRAGRPPRVVAVTEASIAIETRSGPRLKFRRTGRERLA
jgi:hypothetical protein